MFASLTSTLFDGAVPVVGVVIAGAVVQVYNRRKANRMEPAVKDREMLQRHETQISELKSDVKEVRDAVVGTTDILGRPRGDGLMQTVGFLAGTVEEIASNVRDIKKNGNGHT